MIDFYTWATPNGRKVAIMLEECGLEYSVYPIDLGAGEQYSERFARISPNHKIPAIVDRKARGGPIPVFESGAILIYLGEKTGKFLPKNPRKRTSVLEWTMWQMSSVGPMFGQFDYFRGAAAKEAAPLAFERYRKEAARLVTVFERRLAASEYAAGEYSIADMLLYPWIATRLARIRADSPELGETPNVARWIALVGGRRAVKRGMAVPNLSGRTRSHLVQTISS